MQSTFLSEHPVVDSSSIKDFQRSVIRIRMYGVYKRQNCGGGEEKLRRVRGGETRANVILRRTCRISVIRNNRKGEITL